MGDDAMTELSGLEPCIPALRRYSMTLLRDRSEADDLVQDTLVRAIDRIGTRKAEGDTRAWLFAIMHNLFVSRWRRLKRRAVVMVEDASADAATPGGQFASLQIAEVALGLEALPEEQRQVILLVAVEGFGYAEVATILDVPIGTVMSRLSRARDRLNEVMAGRHRQSGQRPVLRRVK